MIHDDCISGLQASLLNLTFSSHFICMSGSFWISVGKWMWEGNSRSPLKTLLLWKLRSDESQAIQSWSYENLI